jgi:hypothetical protein
MAGVREASWRSQVVVGNPPNPIMEDAANASPFGVVMAGRDSASGPPAFSEHEVGV